MKKALLKGTLVGFTSALGAWVGIAFELSPPTWPFASMLNVILGGLAGAIVGDLLSAVVGQSPTTGMVSGLMKGVGIMAGGTIGMFLSNTTWLGVPVGFVVGCWLTAFISNIGQ